MNNKTIKNKKRELFEALLITINKTQILSTVEKKEYIDNLSPKCKEYLYTELHKRSKKNKLSKLEEEFYGLLNKEPVSDLFSFSFKFLNIPKQKTMKLRKGSY